MSIYPPSSSRETPVSQEQARRRTQSNWVFFEIQEVERQMFFRLFAILLLLLAIAVLLYFHP